MTLSRCFTGLVVAIAVVAVLAGCTKATPAAGGTHSPTPHTPSASPTPTQAAIPAVRVPLTCAGLYPDNAVVTLIGVPVVTHIDEATQPTNIVDIAARQYGDLVCLWGGADRTDGGYDQNLAIEIAPDAGAAFSSNIHDLETMAAGPAVENTAGDQSEYYCSVSGELQCSGNMLVGSYWVTASFQNLAGTVPQSIANSRMQGVLGTVAGALATKTALAAWNPPGAVLPGFCTDSGSLAEVNAALGTTVFTPTGDDAGLPDADSYAQLPGVYTQCAWGDASDNPGAFSFVSIAMLRGGSWVVPQLAGTRDTGEPELGPSVSTTIAGADSAVRSCSTSADLCVYMLAIGGVLVNIGIDDPGQARVDAAVTKIVAGISQS